MRVVHVGDVRGLAAARMEVEGAVCGGATDLGGAIEELDEPVQTEYLTSNKSKKPTLIPRSSTSKSMIIYPSALQYK